MYLHLNKQNNVLTEEGRQLCDILSEKLFKSASTRLAISSSGIKTERDIKKEITSKGFDFIGEGIGRSVFHLPPHLLKKPWSSAGMVVKFSRPILESDPVDSIDAQNSAEIIIQKYAHLGIWEPLDSDDFAPIHSAANSRGWLIMAAREPVRGGDILNSFFKKVYKSPLTVDVEESAVGFRGDGKLQFIDYGAPFYTS